MNEGAVVLLAAVALAVGLPVMALVVGEMIGRRIANRFWDAYLKAVEAFERKERR